MAQVKDFPEQTTPVATDQILIQDVSNVTKKITPPNLRKEMVKSGYFDILPAHIDFTGAAAPVRTTVTGARTARAFAGSGGTTNKIFVSYHIPHDISFSLTNYEIHLHLEHNNAAPTGNAKFYLDYYVAQPDGTYSAIISKNVLFTPHATNNYLKNNIVKIESLTDSIASLIPDGMILLDLYRDPADVADTFTDNVFFTTIDIHVLGDMKLTTSKDLGSGWVKA